MYYDFDPDRKPVIETDPEIIKIVKEHWKEELSRMMNATGRNPEDPKELAYYDTDEGFSILSKDFAKLMVEHAQNNKYAELANFLQTARKGKA